MPTGIISPPPNPWITLVATNCVRLPEAAHSTEAMVNSATVTR